MFHRIRFASDSKDGRKGGKKEKKEKHLLGKAPDRYLEWLEEPRGG